MADIEYHLYRIKFVPAHQLSLFRRPQTSPSEIFRDAISSKPSVKFKPTVVWHMGNIETFDSSSGSFAIGRTTTSTVEKYDEEQGDFVEESFEQSPYTFCVYDLGIGLVAIARKSRLAQTTKGIAKKLSELLSETQVVKSSDVMVLVDPIIDPEDFVGKLQKAHAISKFRAWFTGPNPFDADLLFQQPLSVYADEAQARSGYTEVEGPSLSKDVVVSVARSTAAIGNDVSARVQMKRGERPQSIHLHGDPVRKTYAPDHHDTQVVAADMRNEYHRIRGQ